jgi:hypothetical protein
MIVDTRLKLDQRCFKKFQHKKLMPRYGSSEFLSADRPAVDSCPNHHLNKGRVNRPHFTQASSMPSKSDRQKRLHHGNMKQAVKRQAKNL